MDRRPEGYLILLGELDLAWRHIQGQFDKNRQMSARIEQAGGQDEHEWAALGYTLHNLYNAFENYFLRVAKFFENSLEGQTWHRDLVDRMTLSVEGVRPALLTPALRRPIHELRSFRHVFRSIYDSELEPEKVRRVNVIVPAVAEGFRSCHLAFQEKLRTIAETLQSQ